MDNNVFYGEFSLNYWIELILKLDITMPEYQRRFVWSETQVKKLLASLKNKEFVPPVIIGSCKRNGQTYNYIIDGQQRLTAILLAKLGYFPDVQKWEHLQEARLEDAIEYEDNQDVIDGVDDLSAESIKWRYPILFEGNVKREIESICAVCRNSDKYKLFDNALDDDFFSSTFLGFSYLVPKVDDETQQHRYYSTIFRNINFQGTELQAEESREALYFWNAERKYWFKPEFAEHITGHTIKGDTHLDFVRYASIISQYCNVDRRQNYVCRGAKFSYEDYYEQYIYSVAQNINDSTFGQFMTLFTSDENAQQKLNIINQCVVDLRWNEESFDTIIKMDIYFFGLLYFQLFTQDGRRVDITRRAELKNELDNKWNSYTEQHKRAPKAKKYLRQRLVDSINIYERFLV